MSEQSLLLLARMIGLTGLGLLIFSGIGGVVMSSRFSARLSRSFRWLKAARVFRSHRILSLVGASLFLLHPIPTLFAQKTTGGLSLQQMLVPFTASDQTLWIGLGTLAFYVLIIVAVSSLLMKHMKFSHWRTLHYGTYLLLGLGLAHGLFISAEYKPGEHFQPWEPEKFILLLMATIVLGFPIWRVLAKQRRFRGENGG